MPVLRITQSAEAGGTHRVEVTLEGDNIARQTATARFEFALKPEDRARLRWYFEDFLQYPHDPAPTIAARVEQLMREVGVELFEKVFHTTERGRRLWARLEGTLDETRVEVAAEVHDAAAIPWELIRDPLTDVPLAYRASAFVRAHPEAARSPKLLSRTPERVRILLVICRPGGGDDVPFRSVASRLVKGLSGAPQELVDLDVLRPPTFDQLGRVLRAATKAGHPYHLVHFDGHGVYTKTREVSAPESTRRGTSLVVFSESGTVAHGYLLFEHPGLDGNVELVGGTALGKLLTETRVPVLVLNACRSAHTEAPQEPEAAGVDAESPARAFGSLAQQVMDAGVAGVVAMRYNIYVVTAAQFVADLYARLAQGDSLGEAVSLGRKQLHDQPLREIAYQPIPLQDWVVPVVYEAAPLAFFPRAVETRKLTITLHANDTAAIVDTVDPTMPKPPDAGFYGRDETLLALDRTFDKQQIVLLHAYAGSGKTTTAAEFARWYALTGGVEGPVLFTSFEQYMPVARVLDQLGRVFSSDLEQQGVHWPTLSDAERKTLALQVLSQVPVFWLWDNVEPVAGFPKGTPSAWSAAEQRELADFLRAARETRAKFLLTSRQDERGWLGDLPAVLTVLPMPMQERVQLARAIAEKHGHRVTDVEDWRPLLRFTEGNPLTITVLVGQALRDGLHTREQIEAFVARLRAGETVFEDEASEGRSRSLGASLGYGFEHTFTDEERHQLALLYFFHGFVGVDTLLVMGLGSRESGWYVPALSGLTREAAIALLNRAAEVGLLTAHGPPDYAPGDFSVHPALPWYFRVLFEQYYGPPAAEAPRGRISDSPRLMAAHAFVTAMSSTGSYYSQQYQSGQRGVLVRLSGEEANLLHARELARENGWWSTIVGLMEGLRELYQHTGRQMDWGRVVSEIVPDFVDQANDGPLLGRQEHDWSVITEYRIQLARRDRRLEEAERLQRLRAALARSNAALALAAPPNALDEAQKYALRVLSYSLHDEGQIQRERQHPDCVASYEQALALAERLGDWTLAGGCAANLCAVHVALPSLRNLEKAECWAQRALELAPKADYLMRGSRISDLGLVAMERFDDAVSADRSGDEVLSHWNTAVRRYQEALELLPATAMEDLAVTHWRLGTIFGQVGEFDGAFVHFQEAIGYFDRLNDRYRGAQARHSVADVLSRAGRFTEALEYAGSAVQNYEIFGNRAAAEIAAVRRLISQIGRMDAEARNR